jgi:predicted nucleic acid-binding protein
VPDHPEWLHSHHVAACVSGFIAAPKRRSSHQFWPDSVALAGHPGIAWDHLSGHRQLTDAYLLALAVNNGGRFVTIDSRVSLRAVPDARPEQLVVLAGLPEAG